MFDFLRLLRSRRILTPGVGDHVPVEGPLTVRTLRLGDGGAYAMLEFDGWTGETADVAAINERHERLNATWRNIAASDRLVLTSYVCRGLGDPAALPAPHPSLRPYAAGFAQRYLSNISGGRLYGNKLFLGVHLRPPTRGDEFVARRRTGRRKAEDGGERAIDRAKRLEDICDWLASELSDYGPRHLGLATRGRQVFSEIAEALAFAATGVWRPVGLTTGRLGDAMFCEEVAFHHETVEMRGPAHTTYAAQLSWKEYPAVSFPGMFSPLLSAPLRFTFAQHFEPLAPAAGMGLLTRKQNKMLWAGDKALSQIAELDEAADRLSSSKFVMGRHCASLAVFADRPSFDRGAYRRLVAALNKGLRAAGLGALAMDVVHDVVDGLAGPAGADPLAAVVNEAWKILSSCGPTVVRENKAMMAAWLSQIAGNHRYRARPGACSSRNFAAMAPFHGFAKGVPRSRWGAPIITLRTSGGTPYPFHWHDGEGDDAVGNTLVTGETGGGKTAAVGAFIAHTAGRANVVALDHKRGWEALIRHLGGRYSVLGDGRPMFNPLRAMGEEDVPFLSDLYRGCIMQGGWRDLTPEEDRQLGLGIETVMGNPPHQRRLAEVVEFLSPDVDPEGAGARLRRWCRGEDLGWVLDAPECALDLSDGVVGLDTTSLLANGRAASPALLYVFKRIAQKLDGRHPMLLTVDEGWKTMEDPIFFQPIAAQYRTIRSKDGVVVFITQSPGDLGRSPAAKAILEQCPNQLHFPNPRASAEDYIDGLKRTRGEFEALRELKKGSGRFLVCKGKDSLVAELPLGGLEDDLAVVSASEASLRVLDALPDRAKADPEALRDAFAEGRAAAKARRAAMEVAP